MSASSTSSAGESELRQRGAAAAAAAADEAEAGAESEKCVLSVGCFDMFHRGHVTLFFRLQLGAAKLVVGVHDDQSIWQNKKFRTTDNALKRLATVKQALRPQDEAFLIEAQDPTPYW